MEPFNLEQLGSEDIEGTDGSASIRVVNDPVDMTVAQEENFSTSIKLEDTCSIAKTRKKDVCGPEGAINIIFGMDVTAINRIDDASQEVNASIYCKWLYPCFREMDEIWDSKKEEWTEKPWELPLKDGWGVQNLTHWEHSLVKFFPQEEGEYEGKMCTWLAVTMELVGVFSQKFALQRYPFDHQKIVFQFSFWANPYKEKGEPIEGRLEIQEDKSWKCRVQPGACSCADEWSLVDRRLEVKFQETSESPKFQRSFPTLKCELEVKRKPGFITWNIIVPTFFVVLVGIAGLLVSRDFEFDRFAHTGTTVLTLFAIKFSTSYALPKIGYATTLDLYLLTGVMILLAIAGEIAITSSTNDADIRNSDLITAGILFVFWIILTFSLRQISKLLPLLISIDKHEEHDLA